MVRVGRNLELTAFAAELAAPVHDDGAAGRRSSESPPAVRAGERHAGRFASRRATTLPFCLLGQLLKLLAERAPNISVRFFALEPTAGDRLAAGDIDFAILPAEFEPKSAVAAAVRRFVGLCRVVGSPARGRAVYDRRVPRVPASELPLGGPDHGSIAESYLAETRLRAQDRRIHRELRDGAVPVARYAVRHAGAAPSRRAAASGGRNSAGRVAARQCRRCARSSSGARAIRRARRTPGFASGSSRSRKLL